MLAPTGSAWLLSRRAVHAGRRHDPACRLYPRPSPWTPGKVSIYEHSPVLELAEGWNWKARSNRGSVSAPKVILGVNGHIESFGYFRGRLMHIFTYASMTAAYSHNEFGGDVTGADRWALLPRF